MNKILFIIIVGCFMVPAYAGPKTIDNHSHLQDDPIQDENKISPGPTTSQSVDIPEFKSLLKPMITVPIHDRPSTPWYTYTWLSIVTLSAIIALIKKGK